MASIWMSWFVFMVVCLFTFLHFIFRVFLFFFFSRFVLVIFRQFFHVLNLPCLLEVCLSFFGWELVLSFWCGSWPFLSWGVNFCPPFLAHPFSGCGGWPFLLVVGVWAFLSGVRAGPPFSGFGLALARVSHGGGGLFLLSVGVRPPFWEWWLALPSMETGLARGNWPFLAVEEVRHAFFEWRFGPSWTWPSE